MNLVQAYICNHVIHFRDFHIFICWHGCFGQREVENDNDVRREGEDEVEGEMATMYVRECGK